jgi:hypothetical protein
MGDYETFSLLGYKAMWSDENKLTAQKIEVFQKLVAFTSSQPVYNIHCNILHPSIP